MNWYKIAKVDIYQYHENIDEELPDMDLYQDILEPFDKSFSDNGIRSDLNKEPGQIAISDGRVVGGTKHEWSRDYTGDGDEYISVYSFDVAVSPDAIGQGAIGPGVQLINSAFRYYEENKDEQIYMDEENCIGTKMKLEIANQKLRSFFLKRYNRYGLKPEDVHIERDGTIVIDEENLQYDKYHGREYSPSR